MTGSPFLSDAMWLLTWHTPGPAAHSVRLGVAAAALTDLETIGEVRWSGVGDAAQLEVGGECRCEDDILRRWHEQLIKAAVGGPLEARFAISPLVAVAWEDTAGRLVAAGLALATERRHRRSLFSVADPGAVTEQRADLEGALTSRRTDASQHDLVAVAWASGCFDDLFHVHGWESSPALIEAARAETLEDALTSRLGAALAYRNEILRGL